MMSISMAMPAESIQDIQVSVSSLRKRLIADLDVA